MTTKQINTEKNLRAKARREARKAEKLQRHRDENMRQWEAKKRAMAGRSAA